MYTCEFCYVTLLDPTSRSCDQCYYLLDNNDNFNKSTDVDEPENTGNVVIGRGEGTGPQCESCGTCFLSPEAIICNYCHKPDRKRVLQSLLKLSQPTTVPRTQPTVFGHDAKINKSLPGGSQQQQHTGAVTEHSDIGVHSVKTFGESFHSIQHKRSGSESASEQSLKRPKVDNENMTPKNGQSGDQPAPMRDQQHQPVGTNELQTQSPSVDIQIQRTDNFEVYVKPKEPANLLCPSSTTYNQLSSDQRRQSLPKYTEGMADPRYACVQYNIYTLPWSYPPSKLRGLTDSLQSIKVVFHVIIPKPHWEWEQTSKVFLRFGCEQLGSWGANVGPFEER